MSEREQAALMAAATIELTENEIDSRQWRKTCLRKISYK
jgi:hypothetical protein